MGRPAHLGIKDPKTFYSVGASPERQRLDKKMHARYTGVPGHLCQMPVGQCCWRSSCRPPSSLHASRLGEKPARATPLHGRCSSHSENLAWKFRTQTRLTRTVNVYMYMHVCTCVHLARCCSSGGGGWPGFAPCHLVDVCHGSFSPHRWIPERFTSRLLPCPVHACPRPVFALWTLDRFVRVCFLCGTAFAVLPSFVSFLSRLLPCPPLAFVAFVLLDL